MSLFRSSQFRTSLFGIGLLWLLSMVALSNQHRQAVEPILGQIIEEIEHDRAEILELIAAGAQLHPEMIEQALHSAPIVLSPGGEEESGEQLLARYLLAIRQALARDISSAEELVLIARLELLGIEPLSSDRPRPVEAVVEAMEREIPERFHELLHRRVKSQTERWEQQSEAPQPHLDVVGELEQPLDQDRLIDYLHSAGYWSDTYYCNGLSRDGEHEVNHEPIGEAQELPFFEKGRQITVIAVFDDEESEERCLLLPISLDDGSEWWFGRIASDELEWAELLEAEQGGSALLILLLSLALAIWLPRRLIRRLDGISQACQRVAEGDLGARAPHAKKGGDEVDQLIRQVNEMLDSIESLMAGIRQVSDRIAHDLRTPLTRLRGQIDLLNHVSEPTPEIIEAINRNADQLLATFNTLLRIAQVESGAARRFFQRFDFIHVVRDALETYEPVLAERRIQVEVDDAGEAVIVRGDPDLWMQALANIFDNAYKYAPEGGVVRVSLTSSAEQITLIIGDNGPGLSNSDLERVLRRFYRGQNAVTVEGNGLGLSFVKAVAELHGAELELSNDPGFTVTFRWRLPGSGSS